MSTNTHDSTLPSSSRRTACTSLVIHQPIRRRAELVWVGRVGLRWATGRITPS